MYVMTYKQFTLKEAEGLFRLRPYNVFWHWKFWKPLNCIGGKVYFGRYVAALELPSDQRAPGDR